MEDSDKSADVEGRFRGTGCLDRKFVVKCAVNNWPESKWSAERGGTFIILVWGK